MPRCGDPLSSGVPALILAAGVLGACEQGVPAGRYVDPDPARAAWETPHRLDVTTMFRLPENKDEECRLLRVQAEPAAGFEWRFEVRCRSIPVAVAHLAAIRAADAGATGAEPDRVVAGAWCGRAPTWLDALDLPAAAKARLTRWRHADGGRALCTEQSGAPRSDKDMDSIPGLQLFITDARVTPSPGAEEEVVIIGSVDERLKWHVGHLLTMVQRSSLLWGATPAGSAQAGTDARKGEPR